jgi:RNA polymerase sigma-70 factor (ECF subfamily)
VASDAALVALVRLHHARVYRFGLRACRDRFDADDAVQQAFTTLARRSDVIEHEGALKWLFSTVLNACRRLMRPLMRERRHLGERVVGDGDIGVEELTPEALLERMRLVERVREAISELPICEREVLLLRDIEGRSGEEVCSALALTEAAMKSRLHRARQSVRRALT